MNTEDLSAKKIPAHLDLKRSHGSTVMGGMVHSQGSICSGIQSRPARRAELALKSRRQLLVSCCGARPVAFAQVVLGERFTHQFFGGSIAAALTSSTRVRAARSTSSHRCRGWPGCRDTSAPASVVDRQAPPPLAGTGDLPADSQAAYRCRARSMFPVRTCAPVRFALCLRAKNIVLRRQ